MYKTVANLCSAIFCKSYEIQSLTLRGCKLSDNHWPGQCMLHSKQQPLHNVSEIQYVDQQLDTCLLLNWHSLQLQGGVQKRRFSVRGNISSHNIYVQQSKSAGKPGFDKADVLKKRMKLIHHTIYFSMFGKGVMNEQNYTYVTHHPAILKHSDV